MKGTPGWAQVSKWPLSSRGQGQRTAGRMWCSLWTLRGKVGCYRSFQIDLATQVAQRVRGARCGLLDWTSCPTLGELAPPPPRPNQSHPGHSRGVCTSGEQRLSQSRKSLMMEHDTLAVTSQGACAPHARGWAPSRVLAGLPCTCGALGLGHVLRPPFPRLDAFLLHRQGPRHLAGVAGVGGWSLSSLTTGPLHSHLP